MLAKYQPHDPPDVTDWCYLCGERTKVLLDVFIPDNAENGKILPTRYLRGCADCFTELSKAFQSHPTTP